MINSYFWQTNNPDLVEMVEEISSNFQIEQGGVGYNDINNEPEIKPDVRNCQIKWLHDINLKLQILDTFHYANVHHFGFDISHIIDMQYTVYNGTPSYEDSNFYHWHTDVQPFNNQIVHDRKLTMVTLLSDPDEYEGGTFELCENSANPEGKLNSYSPPEFKNKGDMIIFPSYYLHRVAPVTAGVRKTFVSWAIGPKWK